MKRLRNVLVIAGALTILSAMAYWGGTARPGPLFVTGIIVLLGLVSAFGLLVWWLYFSPLPQIEKLPRSEVQALYQISAFLTLICGVLFVTGGMWDAVDHRKLGGFGNDFLWPPHLLIYGALALTALFAIVGLVIALRGGGDLRARFRAAPLPGLLGLVAGYLVLSAPSDQIWHTIYGPDITSWSLPHLTLLLGTAGIFLCGAAIQIALIPSRPWQRLRSFDWRELIAVLLITFACIVLTLANTTEWEGIIRFGERLGYERDAAFRSAFWARPEWLYPVIITTIALFIGNLTLHTLKRPGVATLVGLLALGYRVIALSAFGGWSLEVGFNATAHLLLLPPLIALDLWYAARISQADTVATLTLGNLFAGAGCLVVGLPLISALMAYPGINATTLPPMIGFSLMMALAAGWAGARLGAWLGAIGQFDAAAEQRAWHVEPSLVL